MAIRNLALEQIQSAPLIGLMTEQAERAKRLEQEAWAGRKDLAPSKELSDAYAVALAAASGSALENRLDKKAERMYARRLSAANRSATSGAEQQISAGLANEAYSEDLVNSSIAGEQAGQQNRSAMYSMAGSMADRQRQEYEYNVVQPWLQRLEFSQSAKENQMNLMMSKMQTDAARYAAEQSADSGILGGLLGAAGSIFGGPVGGAIGGLLGG
jgi:hypothetical protein